MNNNTYKTISEWKIAMFGQEESATGQSIITSDVATATAQLAENALSTIKFLINDDSPPHPQDAAQ
ncbi:MAG: hypothetical protein Q7Q73_14675 [Verrucomicrobiota bacterium JB024]|nr:hypothetical protein [Verrucomicrobiota bacterium JB024]